MARMFVLHDASGKILSVASVEAMADGLRHPFYLDDPTHGVLEVRRSDAALGAGMAHVHETHAVDVARGALVPARAPARVPAADGRRPRTRKPRSR